MKKILIASLTLLSAFFCMTAKAQMGPTNYWTVFGGASIPSGEFGKAFYGDFLAGTIDNKAGFAKTGYTIGLDGAWYFHKTNWAIAGTVSYQDQGQLNANDAQILAAGYQDSFGVDQGAVTTSGRYQNLTVLVGPQYSFFFKKWAVDLRGNVGWLKSFSTPEIDIVVTDSGIDHPFSQQSSTASAFAYGGSADLRFNFSKSIGLVLKENYIGATGLAINNPNRVNNAGRLDNSQPIAVFQTTLGLTFGL